LLAGANLPDVGFIGLGVDLHLGEVLCRSATSMTTCPAAGAVGRTCAALGELGAGALMPTR
ncbi:MAG: hypothetical protein ACHP79_12380, partial [Terriglobales bacterium]